MAFCGQCGLQLPPRVSYCPRCGSAVEAIDAMEESHPNDPTIAMLPTLEASPAPPTLPAQWRPTPVPNPPTPLPADTGSGPTQAAGGPTYPDNTPLPPVTPRSSDNSSHPSYPGYSGYSSQPGYPPISGANYQTVGPDAPPPAYPTRAAQSSPGFMPGGTVYQQPMPDSYTASPQTPQRRGNGGMIALIVLLIVLLVGASGFFVLKQQGILFNNDTGTGNGTATATTGNGAGTQTTTAPSPTPSATPSPIPSPTPSPVPLTQQAQTLVQNYYNDINNKDYQSSYNLLGSQMQSQQPYQQYQSGFADTQQDVITFNNSTQQSDGTVRLDVTLQATHTDGTQHTYQGYYIVGPENGTLKILSGHFTQTS